MKVVIKVNIKAKTKNIKKLKLLLLINKFCLETSIIPLIQTVNTNRTILKESKQKIYLTTVNEIKGL